MSLESAPDTNVPAIDKVQIYGANLLKSAKGLETGLLSSITLESMRGERYIVSQFGAENLIKKVKDDFGMHGFYDRPVTAEELHLETEENGRD